MTLTLRTSFATLAVGVILVAGATACGSGDGPVKAGAESTEGTDRAGAAEATEGTISVRSATIDWPANPSVAAVRMVVRNGTGTADELIGVASSIAATSTIHRSETDAEGNSTMTPQDRLAIPARSSVTFEPGGLHVMLTGITTDLAIGDEVSLTLTFEHAGPVTATARVVEPGTATEGDHDH